MYQIKIITTNGEKALDSLEPSFPYTFESASVAELQDQNASWSYTINLPRSANNEAIFKSSGVPFSNTNKPYQRFLCNVYADGIQIIRRGVLFIDSTDESVYHVQIISGIADIFERMKDISLADLVADWVGVLPMPPISGHFQEADSPKTNWAFYYGLILSRDKRDDEILYNNTEEGNLMPYYLPYVRFGGGIKTEREEEQGWESGGILPYLMRTIGMDLELDEDVALALNNLYITLNKKDRYGDAEPIWRSERYALAIDEEETNIVSTLVDNADVGRFLRCTINLNQSQYIDSQSRPIPLTSVLDAFYGVSGNLLSVYVYDENEVEVTHVNIQRDEFDDRGRLTKDIELPSNIKQCGGRLIVGNRPWTYFDGQQTLSFVGLRFSYRIQEMVIYAPEQSQAYSGEKIHLLSNLPFSSAEDVFKFFVQTFGLIINVKEGIIQAHTFDYVRSRRSMALDWSEKVSIKSASTEFYFGDYGQRNYIKMTENPRDGFIDESHFDIINETIAKRADILELPTISGKGLQIDAYTLDEDGEKYSFDMSGSHLFYVEENHAPVRYTSADILAHYQGLADSLERIKVIKMSMLLTPSDIQSLDPYTPIFLRQYGEYFYINKIDQWEEGKECVVELLQL